MVIAGTVQNVRHGGSWNPFEPGAAPQPSGVVEPVVSGISYPLLPLDDVVRYAIVVAADLAILWFWWFVMSRLEIFAPLSGTDVTRNATPRESSAAELTMHPGDRPIFTFAIRLCWVLIVIVMVTGASLLPWTVLRFGWYNP